MPLQPLLCPEPKEIWQGQCVDKCQPGLVHKEPDGACGPLVELTPGGLVGPLLCPEPKEIWEGKCLDKCPEGEVHLEPDGACGPEPQVVQPPQLQPLNPNLVNPGPLLRNPRLIQPQP